mmetsp:Transcript_32099/g.39382  ORF Transcript_32099/g.39382 Transcript_32099/m.39382 type:complete len:620 (+) Transcript_32099:280-2139(+)
MHKFSMYRYLEKISTMARGEREQQQQQQLGNESSINVAIRIRPLNDRESSSSSNSTDRAWHVLPETNSIVQMARPPKESSPTRARVSSSFFTFDRTFDEGASTEDVYVGVAKNIVDGVVSGINGTIFAYGQTSSGKTFTMMGDDDGMEDERDDEGIIQMAGRDIFVHVSKNPDREYLIRVSFLEIYNEQVRDLLSSGGESVLAVREDPKRGVVVNCKEVVVTDLNNLLKVLRDGGKNRQVAFTNMNETSSRSHTIFRVTVESREAVGIDCKNSCDDENGAVLIATMNLVDLAGSESVKHTGATGQRQREGGKINQSLLSLSRVISTLASSNKQFINFRDSKLTRLLQSSLSGNALMSIICCATPSCRHIEETRSTLKFASRAKLVKTKAQKNEVIDDRALIKRLQKELTRLRNEMEEQKKELNKHRGQVQVNHAEDKLNFLKSMILNAAFEDDFTGTKANKRTHATALAHTSPSNDHERPKKCKRMEDMNSASICCAKTTVMDTFRYDHHKVSYTFCSPTKANHPLNDKPNPIILFSDNVNHLASPKPLQNSLECQLSSQNTHLKKALTSKDEQITELQRQLQMRQRNVAALKEENDELRENVTMARTAPKQEKKYGFF